VRPFLLPIFHHYISKGGFMDSFRYRIVQLHDRSYVITRQNVYSQIWYCGDVRGQTAREVATYAARENLVSAYSDINQVSRALYEAHPNIRKDLPEVSFESAPRPDEPSRVMTIRTRIDRQGTLSL
jgi:hypothetical protein